MPIFTLLVAMLAFVSVPVLTDGIYRSSYLLQRRQIFVDNTAILIGGNDRNTFGYLKSVNKVLRQIEAAHHIAHACARSLAAPVACLQGDMAFETTLASLHSYSYAQAILAWRESTAIGRAYLKSKLGR